MNALTAKYITKHSKGKKGCGTKGDIFAASVINQKSVNQSVQQILVSISAQVLNLYEAQFGYASNSDDDEICS